MKKHKIIALALACTFALSSCNTTQPLESASQPDSKESAPKADLKLSMGIGGTGGAKSFYMGGVAKIVDKYVDGVELIGEASAGAATELAMMRSGDMQFCLVTADTTYDAYNSETEPFENLRCVWGCYVNSFVIGTKDPSATDISDYNGKVIAVGPLGGSPDVTSRKILPLLGVEPKEYVNMDFDQSWTAVAEGSAYGFSGCCGNPTSAIYEAETKMDINWIRLTEDQMTTIMNEYPYYGRATLTGDSYKGFHGEDYETIGIWQCIYATTDIDEEVIYNITKAVMEHMDSLIDASNMAVSSSMEAAFNQTVPLHAGAYRYCMEKGIEVPDNLIPPEAK